MVLQASYDEISKLISKKLGHDILLAYKDVDIITATYATTAKLPFIGNLLPNSVSANLHLLAINGNRITIQLDAGMAGSILFGLFKSYILSKAPAGLIESFDGKKAVLNLAAFPQAATILDNLTINGLTIAENCVYVEASAK